MKVTRRKLARMLSTSVAAAAVPAAIQNAALAQTPSTSDEETQSARDLLHNNAQQLVRVKVPIANEPAFHFKA